jgi:signal peptidase I
MNPMGNCPDPSLPSRSEQIAMSSNEDLFKEPWLAVNLSLLLPGAGQFYTGSWIRGAVLLTVWGVCMGSAAWMLTSRIPGYVPLAMTGVGAAVWGYSLSNAHRLARQLNTKNMERKRHVAKDPYLAAFLARLLPGAGHLYLGRGGTALALWMGTVAIAAVGVVMEFGWALFVIYPVYVGAVCLLSWLNGPEGRRTQTRGILVLCSLVALGGVTVHAGLLLAHRKHTAKDSADRLARDRVRVPARLGSDPWED